MSKVLEAYNFALKAHEAQVDKAGSPYYLHVVRVGLKALRYALDHPEEFSREDAENLEIAGYLHDCVEDTKVTLYEIAERFGDDVAYIVLSVTRLDPAYADRLGFTPERKETYREFVERTYKHRLGRVLKREADLVDNMSPERHDQLPEALKGIMHRYVKAKQYLYTGVWPEGKK